jgi:hypothetical protein
MERVRLVQSKCSRLLVRRPVRGLFRLDRWLALHKATQGLAARVGGQRVRAENSVLPANRHVACGDPEFWHPTGITTEADPTTRLRSARWGRVERPGRLLSPKGRPGRRDAPRWGAVPKGLRLPSDRTLPQCATWFLSANGTYP